MGVDIAVSYIDATLGCTAFEESNGSLENVRRSEFSGLVVGSAQFAEIAAECFVVPRLLVHV